MQSSAQKEQQPTTAIPGENPIPVTHTENFDHELVSGAKAELGEEVKTPAQNLGPIQNPEAMRHLLEVVNDVKAAPTESLIGDAAVRKDIPEIPQQPSESFTKKVLSTLGGLREQMYHGYLKRGSRIRFNKSKDNLAKMKQRSELLGQKLKVDEVMHAPKKTETSPEESPVQTEAHKAPSQPSVETVSHSSEVGAPTIPVPDETSQISSIASNEASSVEPTAPAQVIVQSNEVAVTSQPPVTPDAPVDLNAYRQTDKITPVTETSQPQVHQPPAPQSQAA